MTTFEITIIVLLVIIAIAVIYGMLILKQTISYNQMVMDENIRKMDAGLDKRLETLADVTEKKLVAIVNYTYDTKVSAIELTDIVDKMHRNLCVEIADKMVDRIYPDKEPMNKIDWDKLSKEQQDEFLKRLILPNYDNPIQPIYTPCYTPDGICMNPHMDCINCPKRGTGGTWSTNISIKAEDAPLQERFNDNKED